jgi:hypothetical protein
MFELGQKSGGFMLYLIGHSLYIGVKHFCVQNMDSMGFKRRRILRRFQKHQLAIIQNAHKNLFPCDFVYFSTFSRKWPVILK